MSNTLYWHDYETFGISPAWDRPVQFAGIRTDEQLNEIGKPLMIYCRPADDFLPHPQACLITGITPQTALQKGIPEVDFAQQIHNELAQAGTCGVGYNSMRFDDEVSRYLFYRNFLDVYGREWQNGNSRWDMIDVVRLTHALRPEGIEWPYNEEGIASFRLEKLTAANHIQHEGAHDALSDVRATIALARLVRKHQPRLYDYLYQLRKKNKVAGLLDLHQQNTVLHVSSRIPASLGCIAPVIPLAQHPVNKNALFVCDLRQNAERLLDLSVQQIKDDLFTPREQRDSTHERLRIKAIHINKAPVVVPFATLTEAAAQRWQIDRAVVERNRQLLVDAGSDLSDKLQQVFSDPPAAARDVDGALYDGFIPNQDQALMCRLHALQPDDAAMGALQFHDARLNDLLLRYRARNFPRALSAGEQQEWQDFRRERLLRDNTPGLSLHQFKQVLAELRQANDLPADQLKLLQQLQDYAAGLESSL
ncbi:MAG: exodeoxyribonuclease I [gamma proteobacterium symbiont of Bathyaustriella thionipta]|nr:exodeoxyribonuclease I [gamma proteobacterium symbiont of Bathyaustriella thionipta]